MKSGNNNILIGRGANVSKENAMNQIVIGSNSNGHGNNKMVLGNNKLISIEPGLNNKTDLGSTNYQFKNMYIDGNIYKDGNQFSFNDLENCTLVSSDTNGNLFIGENVGAKSLFDGVNISGGSNVVIGQGSFLNNTTGYSNVGLGEDVLQNNTTGYSNTALGYQAGNKITTGLNNVVIGYDADVIINRGGRLLPARFSIYNRKQTDGACKSLKLRVNKTGAALANSSATIDQLNVNLIIYLNLGF